MPTPNSFNAPDSIAAPMWGFLYLPSDSTNILDGSDEILVRRVTTYTDGQITVTYQHGGTAVAIPMIAGVPRDMVITKIAATGTTAQIASDGVICEL